MLSLIASVSGCGFEGENQGAGHEKASVTSPDGASRLVIWMPEGPGFLGATDSDTYQVWLQHLRGEQPRKLMFEATQTDGVVVTWLTNRKVEICYGPTNINRFSNRFMYAEEKAPGVYDVEIVLRRVDALAMCK